MSLLGLSTGLFFSALVFATIAAVALHFLRVRSPQVIVPTVIFWREAVKERAPRVLFKKFARLGTLLLVLAILWAMLVAAGEVGTSPDEAAHEVLVMDPGVFEVPRAGEEAIRKLKSLALANGSVRRAFLLATTPTRVLCGFDDPEAAFSRALQAAAARDAEGDFTPVDWKSAFRTARALLSDRHEPGVRVYSLDPGTLPADGEKLCDAPLHLELLPAPDWDDGLEAAGPVFGPDGTADIMITARRRGAGNPEREFVVEQDGDVLTKGVFDETGQARAVLKGYAPGTRILARLSGEDEVRANDALFLEVPERPGIRVYAPDAGRVLRSALAALERVEQVSNPVEATVAVVRTPEGAGDAGSLPALHFYQSPESENGSEKKGSPVRVTSDHPLVAGLTFQGVRAAATTDLGRSGEEIVLCMAGEGVITKIVPGDSLRVLVGMDPEQRESGLAEHLDFPRFFSRTISALAGEPGLDGGTRRGGWSRVSAGLEVDELTIQGPGGRKIQVPLQSGKGEWMPPAAGSYSVAGKLNTLVPGGGPPLARPPEDSEGLEEVEQDIEGTGGLPFYFILAATALVLLLIEWWALHRGKVA